jgi:hypothetical protein
MPSRPAWLPFILAFVVEVAWLGFLLWLAFGR